MYYRVGKQSKPKNSSNTFLPNQILMYYREASKASLKFTNNNVTYSLSNSIFLVYKSMARFEEEKKLVVLSNPVKSKYTIVQLKLVIHFQKVLVLSSQI